MGVREPRAHTDDNGESVFERELRHAEFFHLMDDGAQVFAVNVLHGDVESAFGESYIEDLHDIGVRKGCGDACFVQQHIDERRI